MSDAITYPEDHAAQIAKVRGRLRWLLQSATCLRRELTPREEEFIADMDVALDRREETWQPSKAQMDWLERIVEEKS